MHIINNGIKDKIKNKNDILKIQKFICVSYQYLIKNFKSNGNELSDFEKLFYLLIFTEGINSFDKSTSDLLSDLSYELIKELLKSNFLWEQKQATMFRGLGLFLNCLKSFNRKTKDLKRTCGILDLYYLDESYDLAQQYNDLVCKDGTSMHMYDVVSGISGRLNYLINVFYNEEDENILLNNQSKIQSQLEFLITLTKNLDNVDENKLSKFLISGIGLIGERELPNGYFDFGLAHGIIGPLIVLSEAFSKKVSIANLDYSINILKSFYKKYERNNNGILYWPTRLSKENFLNNNCNNTEFEYNLSSWCYGNLGILGGLLRTNIILNNDYDCVYYKKALYSVFTQDINKHNLYQIILCHGYLGILTYLLYYMYSGTYIMDELLIDRLNQFILKIISDVKLDIDYIYFDKLYKFYFNKNISLMEGITGFILTLLYLFNKNLIYPELMMI